MTGSIRIIIEGPPEFAVEAVKAILENRESLDRCKTGWGWGIVRSDRRWGAWIRKTKTGYSAKVKDTTNDRP